MITYSLKNPKIIVFSQNQKPILKFALNSIRFIYTEKRKENYDDKKYCLMIVLFYVSISAP